MEGLTGLREIENGREKKGRGPRGRHEDYVRRSGGHEGRHSEERIVYVAVVVVAVFFIWR